MEYEYIAIPAERIPKVRQALLQHAIDIYASETNKVVSVWRKFKDEELGFRPHSRSTTVGEILKHQLLSERRFFAEFLGSPEPAASAVLPEKLSVEAFSQRMVELAAPRLNFLASREEAWWLETARFFDVER